MYTVPDLSGVRSLISTTRSSVLRAMMSTRLEGRSGWRCWATTIAAANDAGRPETTTERASMPPAEAPTTMRRSGRDPARGRVARVVVTVPVCTPAFVVAARSADRGDGEPRHAAVDLHGVAVRGGARAGRL